MLVAKTCSLLEALAGDRSSREAGFCGKIVFPTARDFMTTWAHELLLAEGERWQLFGEVFPEVCVSLWTSCLGAW